MSSDFLEWLKEHKDEYGVKIIENPTEEQKNAVCKRFSRSSWFYSINEEICTLNFHVIAKIKGGIKNKITTRQIENRRD